MLVYQQPRHRKLLKKKTQKGLTATAAEPRLPVLSSSCSDSDWKTENDQRESPMTQNLTVTELN